MAIYNRRKGVACRKISSFTSALSAFYQKYKKLQNIKKG